VQVCTSLQTDNHTSTSPLSFLQAGCPSCRPTNSVKALKALSLHYLPDRMYKQKISSFHSNAVSNFTRLSTSRCLMSSILLTCDLYFTLTCDCLNLIISAVHCYVVKGRTIIKRSAVRSSHSGSSTVLHTLYASALSCCEKKCHLRHVW